MLLPLELKSSRIVWLVDMVCDDEVSSGFLGMKPTAVVLRLTCPRKVPAGHRELDLVKAV